MADEVDVLFIEDDETLRTIVARHLRGSGFTVAEADSAEAAAAVLHGGARPAMVLLDINLPGDTGWEFLRQPALAAAGTPAVVVASSLTIDPRRLAEFGCAGYLPKPYPLETLVATVRRHVRGAA